jgi:DNA polymerase III subunit delta'
VTIIGHDEQVSAFLSAIRGERPHHGWIFAGPKGVGKATLARQLAARLLAEAADPALPRVSDFLPENHQTHSLMNARSHPDFKLVEREVWQKSPNQNKLVAYDLRKDAGPPSRSIKVIQIRWLGELLSKAPSLSNRRVVMIDAADDMETSGANALLKMLEEPPTGTFFILISHAPGRLLPTIRSRCRLIRFDALCDADMRAVMARDGSGLAGADLETVISASGGAPGRATALAGLKLGELEAALDRIAARGDGDNHERAALAHKLALKAEINRYEAFLALVPGFVATKVKERSGQPLADGIRAWEAVRDLAGSAVQSSLDPQATVFALCGHVAALAPVRERAKA